MSITPWIPLLETLVWPVVIGLFLLFFRRQAGELYEALLTAVTEGGRGLEIAGIFKLGEAARTTTIGSLAAEDVAIEGLIESRDEVVKGGRHQLEQLQRALEEDPTRRLEVLRLPDYLSFSVSLLREYIGRLGLEFVVFERNGRLEGWLPASTFIAQLPDTDGSVDFDELLADLRGIRSEAVDADASARTVLERMEVTRMDALPVVDEDGRLRTFIEREDILARLITNLLLTQEPSA